jgi:cancer susceptibility candidate protein 1
MSDKKKEQAPPKLTKKQQEALRHEQAMKQAADDAQRLFKLHERERKNAEAQDKFSRDTEIFAKTQEDDRIKHEADAFKPIADEYQKERRLAIQEYKKHEKWDRVMEVSWLPAVDSEPDIRAFLDGWATEQQDEFDIRPSTQSVQVRVTYAPRQPGQPVPDIDKVDETYVRADCGPTVQTRKSKVDADLNMCVMAVELANNLWREYDRAMIESDQKQMAYCRSMLQLIYDQIISSLDLATINVLQYLDVFIHRDEETLLKAVPKDGPGQPVIKFGLWAKNTASQTRAVNNIRYPDIGVSIDPKESQTGFAKLPKVLYRENCAMRTMQLTFDPFSVHSPPEAGQEYYALDCVILVESMMFQDRVRREKGADWGSRMETTQSRKLMKQEYPPRGGDATEKKGDDYTIKVTFEIPENVVIRHRTPLIGKWNATEKKWDPCSTSNYAFEPIVRKCSFLTSDLTAMAVIQEKGFDVPYEQWQLFPLSDDEVLYVIECRRRGETSDREVKILVQDALCKLISPEEKELSYLRTTWLPPATLMRLLARAGYNFLLQDSDADFIPHVLPKTQAMESKGYQDVARRCCQHAFASTRHNKMGEDPNMTVFRISKERRKAGSEEPFYRDIDEDEKWYSVRYEKERCVLAAFKDTDADPDFSQLPGKETHLNLDTMLAPEYGAEAQEHVEHNYLVENAVLQLLTMTRPFTWG